MILTVFIAVLTIPMAHVAMWGSEALSQLEARAFHKMKMKPRIVATAIPRTNGKWAGSKNSGYMKLSSARLRPLRALVAAI